MAFFDCHFFSDVLGMSVSMHVIIPQPSARQIGMQSGGKGPYPTLYLLHGLSDDHTIWMRRTSIERYAASKNLAVVMPAASRSFYQNMASGPQYWTFISEELPTFCHSMFPLSTRREETFAAGLSMGGYGALRLALAKPDRFSAAASLSGALDVSRRLRDAGREGSRLSRSEWVAMFGSDLKVEGTDADLVFLAQTIATTGIARPRLYLSCGTDDGLLSESQRFRQHVENLGFDVTYQEVRGGHDWAVWDQQIKKVIEWLPVLSAP